MTTVSKVTFIDVGLTIFVKSILDGVSYREALKTAYIVLMDIDPTRLKESHIVVYKLMDSAGASDKITCYIQQKEILQDADFAVVASQIGGYESCTVTDFEICKRHGPGQTITDTLGPGGIIRALRTIPHLWQICEDMAGVCLDVTIFSHANPIVMNTWTMYARYPHVEQVGLHHSVQGTAEELACDLNINLTTLYYRCAGINHIAFYLELERKTADGSYANLCPELLAAHEAGRVPKPNVHDNTRYQNIVRYEIFKRLGYFVAESSEHFTEYIPQFIKLGCEDLTERCKIPLDEYPKHYVKQPVNWHKELEEYEDASRIDIEPSREYASIIMNAIWTGEPSVIYDNVRNDGLIDNLS